MAEIHDICRLCGGKTRYLWSGSLLDITAVKYFDCPVCGYVQTEYPYWLERAYSVAINDSDTGIMARNLSNAKIVLATLINLGQLNGAVLDCAGGYGILVRLLRDQGIEAQWSDQYCKNLLARGFEYTTGQKSLVTAFEAFEHFVNPAKEFDMMFTISSNLLLSSELIIGPTPAQNEWWYFAREHGQHIGFFRLKTLEYLSNTRGKYLTSDGHSYHLFSDIPVNRFVWRKSLKFKNYLPSIVGRKLQSKTGQDSIDMLKKRII
jgi:Methyltransferase domain